MRLGSYLTTHHVLINLVGDDRYEVFLGHLQDGCQVLAAVYGPAGVGRIVDDEGGGGGVYLVLPMRRVDLPATLRLTVTCKSNIVSAVLNFGDDIPVFWNITLFISLFWNITLSSLVRRFRYTGILRYLGW